MRAVMFQAKSIEIKNNQHLTAAGLLYKLKILHPCHYYLILKSYLEDRHFTVQVGSTFSAPILINAGVSQGAVTASLLFNIYIYLINLLPSILLLVTLPTIKLS
jgi:hypothetical protein